MPRIIERVTHKLNRVRSIAEDPDRKEVSQIARDLRTLRSVGESPRFYLERMLYRSQAGSVDGYITGRDAKGMYSVKEKGPGWLRNFDDKLLFDQLMRPSGLPLPDFLGSTRMGAFTSPSGEVRPLSGPDDLVREVSQLIDASDTGAVFAKPIVANKGSGAFRVTAETLAAKSDALFRAISSNDYLFQKSVRQHEGMSALYPDSLNTLRVLIGKGHDGVRPLSIIARMGSDGRPVDNAHAGGIFVGVDMETGRLKRHGHQLYFFGGRQFVEHPDTGVVFEGYQVPRFEEVIDVVQRAHEWLPHPYSGWDIGVTPDGPVIIECNSAPYLLMMDVAHGGIKRDPALRAFFRSHGEDLD